MRISKTLETEESKRMQRGLDYYKWRMNIFYMILCALPAAFVWLTINPVTFGYITNFYFATFLFTTFAIGVSGAFYILYLQTRGTVRFRIAYPDLPEADILFQKLTHNSAQLLTVTPDEIWQQRIKGNFIFPIPYDDERRIHKNDILSLKRAWWCGNAYVIRYRTSFGERRTDLGLRDLKYFLEALDPDGTLKRNGRLITK